jgi:hypothetical protein
MCLSPRLADEAWTSQGSIRCRHRNAHQLPYYCTCTCNCATDQETLLFFQPAFWTHPEEDTLIRMKGKNVACGPWIEKMTLLRRWYGSLQVAEPPAVRAHACRNSNSLRTCVRELFLVCVRRTWINHTFLTCVTPVSMMDSKSELVSPRS